MPAHRLNNRRRTNLSGSCRLVIRCNCSSMCSPLPKYQSTSARVFFYHECNRKVPAQMLPLCELISNPIAEKSLPTLNDYNGWGYSVACPVAPSESSRN
eukprot:3930859-Amphidinium_carterae.1